MCVFRPESGLEMDLIFMYWGLELYLNIFKVYYTFIIFLHLLKNVPVNPSDCFQILPFKKLLYNIYILYIYILLYINTHAHEHTLTHTSY